MNFNDLLIEAKNNDSFAFESILNMYQPLIRKNSIVNGAFDEDLYQELCVVFVKCIKYFK